MKLILEAIKSLLRSMRNSIQAVQADVKSEIKDTQKRADMAQSKAEVALDATYEVENLTKNDLEICLIANGISGDATINTISVITPKGDLALIRNRALRGESLKVKVYDYYTGGNNYVVNYYLVYSTSANIESDSVIVHFIRFSGDGTPIPCFVEILTNGKIGMLNLGN